MFIRRDGVSMTRAEKEKIIQGHDPFQAVTERGLHELGHRILAARTPPLSLETKDDLHILVSSS